MVISHVRDEGRNLTVLSVKGELTFAEQMVTLRQAYAEQESLPWPILGFPTMEDALGWMDID